MSGSVIRPSGRTVTSTDISLSRQNTMASTSSGPMTYPSGNGTPAGTGGAAVCGAGFGLTGVWAEAATEAATSARAIAMPRTDLTGFTCSLLTGIP